MKAARLLPAWILLLLLAPGAPVTSGGIFDRDDQSALELTDTRPAYRVAIVGVVTDTDNRELRPLLGSLSGLLTDMIRGVEARVLAEPERAAMAVRVRTDRSMEVEREIAEETVRADRGSLLGSSPESDGARREELRREASLLKIPDRVPVHVAATKAIELVDVVPEVRRRLVNDRRHLERHDADMVLYLVVESVEEYLLATVWSVQRHVTERREVCRAVALPEELAAALEECAPDLVAHLAGGRYGELKVRVFDVTGRPREDAAVFLDARYVGDGTRLLENVTVGERELVARSPRGASVRETVVIASGERAEVTLVLPAAVVGELRIESDPAGADVYRGVEWVGTAPVVVPAPDAPVQFALRAPGYLEGRAMAGERRTLDTTTIEKALIEESYDWEADFDASRRRFYNSFALFLGSVAVPIVLNGVYQDYFGLFPGGTIRQDINIDDASLYTRRATTVFYAYYGSLGVSTLFLGNLVWRLADYIRVGQGYHTR